jgi:hypothetical protein
VKPARGHKIGKANVSKYTEMCIVVKIASIRVSKIRLDDEQSSAGAQYPQDPLQRGEKFFARQVFEQVTRKNCVEPFVWKVVQFRTWAQMGYDSIRGELGKLWRDVHHVLLRRLNVINEVAVTPA